MVNSFQDKRLGLIAGNGRFPFIFAQEAKREGYCVVAVAHRDETVSEIERVVDELTWVYVGQLGKIIRTFQRARVTQAVMAGGIHKVRLFGNFRPDLRGASFLARLKRRDDDALLRGIADELEKDGITILESTLCVPQIITTVGVLTRHAPSERQWEDIQFGIQAAKEIGRLGIGQTVVVKNRMVIAVEAVEGTDEAIKRGGSLARSGCVVVKVSKPHQDLRFDVPAVGIETIKKTSASGRRCVSCRSGENTVAGKGYPARGSGSRGNRRGRRCGLINRANMQSVQRIAAAVSGFGYVDQFDAVKYALAEKADRGGIAVVGVAA